jgi:branched-chain amino acid transport system substrate-binding protein
VSGGRLLRASAVVTAAVALSAACSTATETAPIVSVLPAVTTTIPSRVDDGVLRLGTLLPTTGAGAGLGSPLTAAVQSAVDAINAQGGVLGRPVELVTADETSSVDLGPLVSAGVDAIIGPASSNVALRVLGQATTAGIVLCSPTATAIALDSFPDQNLFFRTVGSDSLQMSAIARTAARTGSGTIAIAYLDDRYGRDMATELREAIAARSILGVVAEIPFNGDDPDLSDEATAAIESEAGIVIILGDTDDGGRLLGAVDRAIGAMGAPTPFIIVNDSLRAASQTAVEMSGTTRERVIGVAPRSIVPNIDDPSGHFATNAHDCVNLIALASLQAASDNPGRIAAQMASVSSGGRVCATFEDCARIVESGLQIDYAGLSGPIELSTASGDLVRATFNEFRFDAFGNDVIANAAGFEIG